MTRLPPELDPQNDIKRFVLAHVSYITCADCKTPVVLTRKCVCRCRCGVYRWNYSRNAWEWQPSWRNGGYACAGITKSCDHDDERQ
jgi:hypothetical protein